VTYGTTYETYIYIIYIEREIPQQTRLCGARSGSPQLYHSQSGHTQLYLTQFGHSQFWHHIWSTLPFSLSPSLCTTLVWHTYCICTSLGWVWRTPIAWGRWQSTATRRHGDV